MLVARDVEVRQGKRFELEVEGELTEELLAEVRRAAETLLANTVIETFAVRVEADTESPPDDDDAGSADGEASEDAEASEQAAASEQTESGEQVQAGEQAELATQAG